MNWQAISFDWNQVRAFLVTVEEGSFSATARALGTTQPTVSRQIDGLEAKLGVTLFERGRRSMKPTSAGLELVEHVRVMGEAANRVSLAASGQALAIEGLVTITATGLVASHHLPPILKRLRVMAPEIEIEIIASNDVRDLRKREADIAIRHGRPEHPDLIAKLLGDIPAYLYAATGYLDRMGRPQSVRDLANHDFIGFDQTDIVLARMRDMGISLSRDNLKLRSASGSVILQMVRQGLGISMLPDDIARNVAELERVLADEVCVEFPAWLVTHRELRTSRRIRLVYDLLAEELGNII